MPDNEKVPLGSEEEIEVTEEQTEEAAAKGRPWYGVLAPVGRMSADDRIFDSEMEFSWRDLPNPLKYMPKDLPGHDESVTVASIEGLQLWNNLILGWGHFVDNPAADEAYGLIQAGALRGVSVDLDQANSVFEDESGDVIDETAIMMGEVDPPERVIQRVTQARLAAATICAIPAFAEAFVALGERPDNWEDMKVPGTSNFDGPVENPQQDGAVEAFRDYTDEERKGLAETGEAMPDGSFPIVDQEDLENAIQSIGRASDPEAAKEHIIKRAKELELEELIPADWLSDEEAPAEESEGPVTAAAFNMVNPVESIVAGASELPASWFKNPELSGPTPMTITEDGQVYGHAATWNECHIGIQDKCVTAPHSITDYAYFHTGEVSTSEGPVAVGAITMGTGHAELSASQRIAAAHYDNTGTVIADVRMGEDKHGIWFSGALRAGATDEQIHSLRAAAISGDWRPIGAGLEFVAALAVNTPGFPIPRTAVAASGAEITALVAAAPVQQTEVAEMQEFDMKAFASHVADELEARAKRGERRAALAARLQKENSQKREAILARVGEED